MSHVPTVFILKRQPSYFALEALTSQNPNRAGQVIWGWNGLSQLWPSNAISSFHRSHTVITAEFRILFTPNASILCLTSQTFWGFNPSPVLKWGLASMNTAPRGLQRGTQQPGGTRRCSPFPHHWQPRRRSPGPGELHCFLPVIKALPLSTVLS